MATPATEPRVRIIMETGQLKSTQRRQFESDEVSTSGSPTYVATPPTAFPPPSTPSQRQAPGRQTSAAKLSLDGMSLVTSPSRTDGCVKASPTDSTTSVIFLPATEAENGNNKNDETNATPTIQGTVDTDSELQRRQDEEDESIALARMLMAQEAMESYAISADYLRHQEDAYSPEDLAALQAAMAEEEPDVPNPNDAVEGDLSYDAMLRLGERIGDVKQERWSFIAKDEIAKLPRFKFVPSSVEGKDENDSSVKCLVCQCPYEDGECLRQLPCGHCFHTECVDQWLMRTDICPYCRQTIQDST